MRRLKKKYKKPKRPWNSERIEEESNLLREYGLRRKRELWRAESIVRDFRQRARDLIAVKNPESTEILLKKLSNMGVLKENMGLENVLSLKVKDVLERRLQTLVFRKGHASTVKNARQKIVHGHVHVGDRIAKFPAFLVSTEMEKQIKVKENE